MLYQHENIKIAVRLLANDVHMQEYHVTASPTGIHNEQKWTSMVPITVGQTLALEYRIIGLEKSCMVDVKIDGVWRLRKMYGTGQTVRELVDAVIMKEKHALYHAKMCAKDQSNPDPYGSDDEGDDDFAPVKGSAAFEVGNIELLFFTAVAEAEKGIKEYNPRSRDYTYRKGPYFENDPERGLTQRAASDPKLTAKVYEEAGPATCGIDLLQGTRLSESEEATAKFEAKRPLLSSVPFVTFKFLYRDQRVLSYECDQPSQDITSASVSSGFWAPLPPLLLPQLPQQPPQPRVHADQSQQPQKRWDRGNKKKKHRQGQIPFVAATDIGAGASQNARAASDRPSPLVGSEQQTLINVPPDRELITPSSPIADTIATVRKSSLAKPQLSSNRKTTKTVHFAPIPSSETLPASAPVLVQTPYFGENTVVTPASPIYGNNQDFSDEKFMRCLSLIGDISETSEATSILTSEVEPQANGDLSSANGTRSSLQDDQATHTEYRRLYVGNLGPGTTEQDLRELFEVFAIKRVEIPLMQRTQKSAARAFITVGSQAEADRAVVELDGKTIRSRPVKIRPLGKSKSTEAEKRLETDVEASIAAEAFLNEFVPDVLRNENSTPSTTDRGRLGSPPALASRDPTERQNSFSVDASVPTSEQNDRLTSSIQTRKRKLEEMEQFQEEMEAFRRRQRDEMEDFHNRQREEMEEFQKRQREEIEEKMENWKADTADLERTAKRRKIVLNRSAEPESSQDPVGSREIEGGAADADAGADAGETGAPDSTNTTYGPHELNLRAISERLGRIDDLKSRQADGETLATSDLLEIKMEEQVRLELSREIKSSPGLEPRAMEDVDQDLSLLDAPSADQTNGTRNAGASSSITPMADAGHDQDEAPAARPDVKMEDREFGEAANTNSKGKGTSRAEKTKVYIKLEDDDD